MIAADLTHVLAEIDHARRSAVVVDEKDAISIHLVRWDGFMCYLETLTVAKNSIEAIRPFDAQSDRVNFPCAGFANSIAWINLEGMTEKVVLGDDAKFVNSKLKTNV